jgi:hypothetical protein
MGDVGGKRSMIVCSCTVISDRDIEAALLEILNRPDAPIPTPGVVYRHLQKRMNCCGCAPLAVETIYNKVDELERKGLISPNVCEVARSKLLEFSAWRPRTRQKSEDVLPAAAALEDGSLKVA